MPGHVKRGGTGEPDPDPSPFLFVSWEDKQNDMAKVILIFQLYITILKQENHCPYFDCLNEFHVLVIHMLH